MLDLAPPRTEVPAQSDEWRTLRLYAQMYSDMQGTRIATENRLRSETVDADFVLEVETHLAAIERDCARMLRNAFKRVHPELYAWTKETRGVGEHTVARLLGLTGHPRYAYPKHWEGSGADRVLVEDEPHPRGIRQFYAYCGVGDPARRRRKGMVDGEQYAAGNPRCKPLVYLLSEAQVKTGGEYRPLYDEAKQEYLSREEWTIGHCHNAALRRVGKQILRDIWEVA